jgi:hypothetical protein
MAFLMTDIACRNFGDSDTHRNQPGLWARYRKTALGCLLPIIVIAGIATPVYGDAPTGSQLEYRIKAAFLLNFCKYVSWPSAAFDSANDPIIVCVLGESPIRESIDTITGKLVQGHALEIRFVSDPEDLSPCHLLFVGDLPDSTLYDIIARITGTPILTVSDRSNFVKHGGMIDLVKSGNRIRFLINPAAVENAGLKMSSQLLKLAIIYDSLSLDGE